MTIEELPRYERLPGSYRVLQIGANLEEAVAFLKQFGNAQVAGDIILLSPNQYRESHLKPGDYVTFREMGYLEIARPVITYSKADFEDRYRRIPDNGFDKCGVA